MNGDDMIATEPAPASGNIIGDFFGAATAKIGELTDRFTSLPSNTQSSVGGSIFEAIYQYSRGRVDLTRERAAQALIASKTGQRFIGEVERQRIQQYLPWIIGSVIILFLAGFLIRGR